MRYFCLAAAIFFLCVPCVAANNDPFADFSDADKKRYALTYTTLLIEKYCPQYTTNLDMFRSFPNVNDSPVIPPDEISSEDRARLEPLVDKAAQEAGSGFKPGSPMDLQGKCQALGVIMVDTLHLYNKKD